MLKWIYGAHRADGLSREDFPTRWRRHAGLSESFADITATFSRNTQATVVPGSSTLGFDETYDGICILDITSLDAARNVYGSAGIPAMMADEREVFAVPTSETCATAVEVVVRPGPRGKALILELVRRLPGQDERAFVDAWICRHSDRLMEVDGVASRARRVAHNLVVMTPPARFDHDGVGELWFDDVDQARAAAEALGPPSDARADGFELSSRLLLSVTYTWQAGPPSPPA